MTTTKIKLKQGNVAIVSPIPATKSDFGDYEIQHPLIPMGTFYPGKYLTIKEGKVVGMVPELAKKLGLQTVGIIQDKTDITKAKEAAKEQKERVSKEQLAREAKLLGGSFGIDSAVKKGLITVEEGEKRMRELVNEYKIGVYAVKV